nr:type II toxin-antitoxin system VapC family toxin [Phytoactinopolyspora mesophila]
MVVDTSAVTAVLFDEPGSGWLINTLVEASRCYMSTGTYLELGIVLESRFGPTGTGTADRFVRDSEITLVDVTPEIALRSLEGWRRFGKGRHPAALNYGDCFTYGLAAERDLPILCTGEDFAQTDMFVLRPGHATSGSDDASLAE